MAQPGKKLFLLDAYALIYRAHFAFLKNPRINSKGINTSVPFGFTNTLLEVLQKQAPTHIGVAFDTAAPTFRDEIFDAYKANRQETPEDIKYGIPKVKEIIRGFNIPILEIDGYEADDVIGTLSTQAAEQGFQVFMMTPDKDFGQLVKENVFLFKPAYMGNSFDIMGIKEVCEKWDIKNISQVVEILGLQGDTSDNIPGIPGVGPKTAADLIRQFGTIENVIAHVGELKGKLKERVEQFGEQAILSKKLATIILDVPVAFEEENLRYTGPDNDKLRPILEDLEFKTMIPRIFTTTSVAAPVMPAVSSLGSQLSMFGGGAPESPATAGSDDEKRNLIPDKVSYHTLETAAQRSELIEKLKLQKEFALETITDDAPNLDFALNGLTFSFFAGQVGYVVINNSAEVVREFAGVLEDEKIKKTGHNIKLSILALKKHGIEVHGQLFDTMLAHYLIEPEASHDLAILCNQYLNYQLLGGDQDEINKWCERTDQILQLKQKLQKELEIRRHSLLLRDVEIPLVNVLAAMEFEGVRVDEGVLKKMSDSLKIDSEKVQREIYSIAGTEFNIGSPKQMTRLTWTSP